MCLLGTVGQCGILQFLGKCPTAVSENKLASTQKSALGGIPLTLEVICNTLPGADLKFLRWHYISYLDLLEFLRHHHLLIGHLQFRDSCRGPLVGVPEYLPPRHQIPIGPSHFISYLMLLLCLNCKSAHSQLTPKLPLLTPFDWPNMFSTYKELVSTEKRVKCASIPQRCYVVVSWQLQ